jgi:hypothetical protein
MKSKFAVDHNDEELLHNVSRYGGQRITRAEIIQGPHCQIVFEVEGLAPLIVPVERLSIAEWCERLLTKNLPYTLWTTRDLLELYGVEQTRGFDGQIGRELKRLKIRWRHIQNLIHASNPAKRLSGCKLWYIPPLDEPDLPVPFSFATARQIRRRYWLERYGAEYRQRVRESEAYVKPATVVTAYCAMSRIDREIAQEDALGTS